MGFFSAAALAALALPLAISSEGGASARSTSYFTQPEFDFRAGYTEAVAEFDLPILNRTGKPLKLLSVETSCSCMKVALSVSQLAPGAAGSVHCVFTVPNALGRAQKPVILKTDAPFRPKEVALVRVEVPGILRATPERLTWSEGDSAEEKVLRITVAESSKLRLTKVECSRDSFAWSLQTIEDGREYELHVTPKDTTHPLCGMFLIQTDSPVPRQKNHSFCAEIKPPPHMGIPQSADNSHAGVVPPAVCTPAATLPSHDASPGTENFEQLLFDSDKARLFDGIAVQNPANSAVKSPPACTNAIPR